MVAPIGDSATDEDGWKITTDYAVFLITFIAFIITTLFAAISIKDDWDKRDSKAKLVAALAGNNHQGKELEWFNEKDANFATSTDNNAYWKQTKDIANDTETLEKCNLRERNYETVRDVAITNLNKDRNIINLALAALGFDAAYYKAHFSCAKAYYFLGIFNEAKAQTRSYLLYKESFLAKILLASTYYHMVKKNDEISEKKRYLKKTSDIYIALLAELRREKVHPFIHRNYSVICHKLALCYFDEVDKRDDYLRNAELNITLVIQKLEQCKNLITIHDHRNLHYITAAKSLYLLRFINYYLYRSLILKAMLYITSASIETDLDKKKNSITTAINNYNTACSINILEPTVAQANNLNLALKAPAQIQLGNLYNFFSPRIHPNTRLMTMQIGRPLAIPAAMPHVSPLHWKEKAILKEAENLQNAIQGTAPTILHVGQFHPIYKLALPINDLRREGVAPAPTHPSMVI
ncbi:MAG: hypothetical protein ACK4PR_11440 [Gammaproteobacteria bacterium]